MAATFDRKSPQCHQLLRFVSNELYLDGGSTLAPWLKEYAEYPKRINGLLLATVKTKRLLLFIEQFPETFSVSREKDPHTITLRTLEFCDETILDRNYDGDILEEATRLTADAVREKAEYVLRRRESRLSRRQNSKAHAKADHEAGINWLLGQCSMELHKHLRSAFFYPSVYNTRETLKARMLPKSFRVGEKRWSDLVLAPFRILLESLPKLRLSNDKVAIVSTQHADMPSMTNDEVGALSLLLRETIAKDGATQVCLALLLSRYDDLRRLLAGRDLMDLVTLNREAFLGIKVWKNDVGGVVLRLTGTCEDWNGRMEVDEVGLFSVASGRWGAAIGNVLAQEASKTFNLRPDEIDSVDLTASVGGLTLALSKRFRTVFAIEIDKTRSELCRQNMEQHCRANVRVLNIDAMEALDKIGVRSVVIIIDPPWGGHEYKRLRKPVTMDKWTLEDVIGKIGQKASPAVVGVRLPVNFCCVTFEKSLAEEGVHFETLARRKLGAQLLLVIAIATSR